MLLITFTFIIIIASLSLVLFSHIRYWLCFSHNWSLHIRYWLCFTHNWPYHPLLVMLHP